MKAKSRTTADGTYTTSYNRHGKLVKMFVPNKRSEVLRDSDITLNGISKN